MKLASFCILTALSMIYAGLTLVETMTYHKWEDEVNNQKYLQAQVAFFDHLNGVLDEMLKRMAYLSQHDPAMAQLLKDRNINVVVQNPPAPATNSFDAPAPVNPAASSPAAQVPSTQNPEHP